MSINDLITFFNYPLDSDLDFNLYTRNLAYLPDNPLYRKEFLIAYNKDEDVKLSYFFLSCNSEPCILMPIVFRRFNWSNNKEYWHAFSPYGYNGPLYNQGIDAKLLTRFWIEVDSWYQKNNVITEFIRFGLNKNWEEYSGIVFPTLVNICGRILEKKEQWLNFKPKVRNNYRKALRENLECKIYHKKVPKNKISEFYSVYIDTMKRVDAENSFLYSLEFFEKLILNNLNRTAIAILYKNKIPISVELLLLSSSEILSFLGGTLAEYFYTRPNDFLKIEVINWARLNGFSFYILGGGRKNNDNLFQYKKSFFYHDPERIFHTGRKIIKEDIYKQICNSFGYEPDSFKEPNLSFPIYLKKL